MRHVSKAQKDTFLAVVKDLVAPDVDIDCTRAHSFLVDAVLIRDTLSGEEVMVFSPEDFISLSVKLLLRCLCQIMERLPLLTFKKQARSVKVHLDLVDAEHVCNSAVVEDDLIIALSFKVVDLRIVNTFHII